MSLQENVVTGQEGLLTSPEEASADRRAQTEEESVRRIADGIYGIGGWGIGNIIVLPSKTDVSESVAYYSSDQKLLASDALASRRARSVLLRQPSQS